MTLALSNQIMAQVFMTFPFSEADGLSTEQLFKPVHPIASDSPETFSPPSEGIYDLEAFFDFEVATHAESVKDQHVLGAESTAIAMCSDFPVTIHGYPPMELSLFLTGISAGIDDALETNPPTFLAEPLSSTESNSFQATAIGLPPATSHVNIGHCTPDTSSGNNTWKSNSEAVSYGNHGENASHRLAGAVQAAPDADDIALCDLEPNNANPIRSIAVGLNTASKTGKSPSRRGKKSLLPTSRKTKNDLVIYVRAEYGDLIRIKWDKHRQKFVCEDLPGRRLYLVSVKTIEHFLSNPEQGVKLEYWRYY
ncbi:hypothetical protein F5B17DRAFT_177110 [Nemania serpens]|nr:hypothetical protein F5B17DRAFT_177110 [Nemania serpens]